MTGAALAILLVVISILIFCSALFSGLETALFAPYRLSSVGALTLRISMPLLERVGHRLERVSTFVIDLLTPAHLRTRPRLSDEELRTLLEMGEEEGALHEEEGEIIEEIIKLGDKTAK